MVIDLMPMSTHSSELGDDPWSQPLMRFKLIAWEKTGETSLSVAWGHVLGLFEITQFPA